MLGQSANDGSLCKHVLVNESADRQYRTWPRMPHGMPVSAPATASMLFAMSGTPGISACADMRSRIAARDPAARPIIMCPGNRTAPLDCRTINTSYTSPRAQLMQTYFFVIPSECASCGSKLLGQPTAAGLRKVYGVKTAFRRGPPLSNTGNFRGPS